MMGRLASLLQGCMRRKRSLLNRSEEATDEMSVLRMRKKMIDVVR